MLALLRNPEFAVYGHGKVRSERVAAAGEDRFNELSVAERGKFEEETLVNVAGRLLSSQLARCALIELI